VEVSEKEATKMGGQGMKVSWLWAQKKRLGQIFWIVIQVKVVKSQCWMEQILQLCIMEAAGLRYGDRRKSSENILREDK